MGRGVYGFAQYAQLQRRGDHTGDDGLCRAHYQGRSIMTYLSTKTYGHEVGFSCAFRQWRAASHCSLIHGYALSIAITFEAEQLDDNNWVVDFGGMGSFKEWLTQTFDHTLLVAWD